MKFPAKIVNVDPVDDPLVNVLALMNVVVLIGNVVVV